MKYGEHKNGFFLPNELFQLGLDYGELAVYSFLKRCENRKTHQCWPSIKTIGQAVGMSAGGAGAGSGTPAGGQPPARAGKPRVTACGPL